MPSAGQLTVVSTAYECQFSLSVKYISQAADTSHNEKKGVPNLLETKAFFCSVLMVITAFLKYP